MLDWRELVKRRLGPLGLDPQREEEIVAELAHHLEETGAEHVREGLPDSEAVAMAMASVTDWKALRRKIRRAERGRPGAPAFLLMAVPILLSGIRYLTSQSWDQPDVSWHTGVFGVRLGIPAFVALIAIGFLVAHLCARVGGSRRDQVLTAVFGPASSALMGLLSYLLSYVTSDYFWPLPYTIMMLLSIGVLPSLLLLIGALTHGQLARRAERADRGQEPSWLSVPMQPRLQGVESPFSLGVPWLSLMIGVPLYYVALIFVDPAISTLHLFQLKSSPIGLPFSGPLLANSVLLGFLLAYGSRRVGGGSRMQLVVALVPAAWWLVVLAFAGVLSPLALLPWPRIYTYTGLAFSTSIAPALGLALGAVLAMVVGRSTPAARRCEFAAARK